MHRASTETWSKAGPDVTWCATVPQEVAGARPVPTLGLVRALMARLRAELKARDVPVAPEHHGGGCSPVTVGWSPSNSLRRTIRARKGVLVVTGGFERNGEMPSATNPAPSTPADRRRPGEHR